MHLLFPSTIGLYAASLGLNLETNFQDLEVTARKLYPNDVEKYDSATEIQFITETRWLADQLEIFSKIEHNQKKVLASQLLGGNYMRSREEIRKLLMGKPSISRKLRFAWYGLR